MVSVLKSQMKIFQVETADHYFVVIAIDQMIAKRLVRNKYFGGERGHFIKVTGERELREGIVLSYDYEDIYWQD